MNTGGHIQLRQNGVNHVLGQINLAQMMIFESFLLNYGATASTYRNVKNNPDWQGLYNYATRPVSYCDKYGTVTTKNESSVPCRECGVLLHSKLVTIDHTNARKGDPLDPVFKLFRAVGYSEQAPTGPKGTMVMQHMSTGMGGNNGAGNGHYSLNPIGVIVFSLFRNSAYYNNLLSLSMHHFVNLRPVCSHCNPSLGVH